MVKAFSISRAAVIWIGLVAVAIMSIIWHFSGPGNDFKDAPTQIGNCKDPAIAAVVYSIQSHPDRWDADHFYMTHGRDVSIWIANDSYGLTVGKGYRDVSPNNEQLDDACRGLLYDATQTWSRNTLNASLRN